MSDENFTENRSNLSPENYEFYEIMWRNMVDPDWSQIIIRSIRIVCWTIKATDTYSECVIIPVCGRQKWLRESALTLRVFVLCLS